MHNRSHPARYVIDASVVAKWHLLDEEGADIANVVLDDFRDGRIGLIAPHHVFYEVPNAVRKAMRLGRVSETDARLAIQHILSWQIETFHTDQLVLDAFELTIRIGCSFYDGLYVALARASGNPLIYADARLRNTLGDRFPLSIWLDDYVSVRAAQ